MTRPVGRRALLAASSSAVAAALAGCGSEGDSADGGPGQCSDAPSPASPVPASAAWSGWGGGPGNARVNRRATEPAIGSEHYDDRNVLDRPDVSTLSIVGRGDTAYVAAARTIRALGPTGSTRWTASVSDAVEAVAIAGGRLVVTAGDRCHALSLSRGCAVSTVDLPDAGTPVAGTPVVDGRVVLHAPDDRSVGTATVETGTVDWFDAPVDEELRGVAATDGRLFAAETGSVVAFDLRAGTELWRTGVGTLHERLPPVAVADAVYVVSGEGALIALDAGTGTERWRTDPSELDVSSPPAATPDAVYVTSWDDLARVDPSDGTVSSVVPGMRLETGGIGAPVLTDSKLYVPGQRELLVMTIGRGASTRSVRPDVAELFPTGAGFFYRTTSRGGGDIYHVPP